MVLQARQHAIPFLLFCTAAGLASASTISCVPAAAAVGAAPGSFQAIRKISIDEQARIVNMDVVRARTKDTETMGKARGELLSVEENPSGEPVYVFNAVPVAGTQVMRLFRLSKAADWRLVGADVGLVGKVPVLRSVEPGVVFDCKRSGMG